MKDKCLRYRIKLTLRLCWLCEAIKEAKGRFEYARRLFIKRKIKDEIYG